MSVSVPILMYHSISDQATPAFRPWVIPPDIFDAQMRHIQQSGYTALTASQFADVIRAGGDGLPARPIVLTFDDAFADFYETVMPTLARYDLVATLYVPTSYVGETSRWLQPEGEENRPLMSWQQLGEAHQAGIEIGSHTLTHPQLDLLSEAALQQELQESKNALEDQLSISVTSFAYPFGYYRQGTRQAVIAAGYSNACAVRYALSSLKDDPYTLARIIIKDVNIDAFDAQLAGAGQLWQPYERLRSKIWYFVRRIK